MSSRAAPEQFAARRTRLPRQAALEVAAAAPAAAGLPRDKTESLILVEVPWQKGERADVILMLSPRELCAPASHGEQNDFVAAVRWATLERSSLLLHSLVTFFRPTGQRGGSLRPMEMFG